MATTDETFVKDEPVEGFTTEEPAQGVKRPADAPNENQDEPPSKVAKANPTANPNSFKNVFKQLSLMRPGLFFEMEKEVNEEEGTTTFTMVVDVDGVKFHGTGPSKRNAKVVAAEQVLAHLESLGVKPREPKEGEVKPKAEPKPKPEAPPASKPLSEEQKALQMTGKNPVMMLHEIRPNFECDIESDERKGAHRKVVMSVTVEGQKFVGSGRSNKNARARAAVSALESLFGLSFTEFGENEIPVYLGDEWAWRKFTKRAEKKEQPTAAPGKPVKNAVMQLNDMYKGLEFNVIDRSGPDHCPFFKVSVDIEGQKFEGQGTTKKAAKLSAAEKALDGLALTGVLAQRATQKKQHQWGKQNKGPNFVPAGEGQGAADGGENGNGEGNTEQNGQSSPRGKGRGGRGGRGRGRGFWGGGRGGGGGFRGRGGGGGGFRGRGGQNRGRGGGGGAQGSQGWGNQGDGSGNMMRGRGRGGWGRGGGGRGGGGRGGGSGTGADGQGSADWTQSSSGMSGMGSMGSTGMLSAQTDTTDYSYQDPYTSTESNTWNTNSQSSYNMFDNSYIDNSYGDSSNYGASYNNKSSYDTTATTGTYDNSYNNAYQADTSNTWSDYGYGY